MAKQIIWSLNAQQNRKEIFLYWNNRNKSKTYSKKLNRLIKGAVKLISEFPQIGRPADLENIRIKIVRDYLVVYEVSGDNIYILAIWDDRQDPEKLKKIIK